MAAGTTGGGNPWLRRRIIGYAHQGGAWERPSSTLLAMRHALAAGATALELDVHATVDEELVVCHDDTVDRTTSATGSVATMTLAEIQSLDPAYWFVPGADVTGGRPAAEYPFRGRAPDDPALRIPRLAEVFEAFPGVVVNLDIKRTAPAVQPYERTLAQLLEQFERVDDVIVASFFDSATEAFRRYAPHVATAAGTTAVAEFWRAVHTGEPVPHLEHCALQVPVESAGLTVVDEDFVSAAHGAGIAVHVWTINEPALMASLVELGVDGIISDAPTDLVSVLERTGTAWDGVISPSAR